MICKTANISHGLNALQYCERGGEFLVSHKCFGSAVNIHSAFLRLQNRNTRTKNKSIHAILAFNPLDRELSSKELIEIAEAYAHKQRFGDNQYVVYLHTDKAHLHLHIVANRIGENIKSCSNSKSFYRNIEFSIEIEKNYNLIPTNRKELKKEPDFVKDNSRVNDIKNRVDKCIFRSNNFQEFLVNIEEFNLKALVGRGITFVDEDHSKIKGSLIGREYSLGGIQRQLQTKGLSSSSSVPKSSSPKTPVQAQEKSVQLSSSSSPSLSENNGNMNSDIDEIIKSGKKNKRSL